MDGAQQSGATSPCLARFGPKNSVWIICKNGEGSIASVYVEPSSNHAWSHAPMPTIYEKRTYSVTVGKMSEVVRLYQTLGFPALEAGGFSKNLIGYFTSDTGELHQLIHLWRFDSDEDRRAFWKRLFEDKDFMAFAVQLRPLLKTQANQLLLAAPWGPHP
jgi:hypothetical protein